MSEGRDKNASVEVDTFFQSSAIFQTLKTILENEVSKG